MLCIDSAMAWSVASQAKHDWLGKTGLPESIAKIV
jgi:hypothetical protein